MPEDVLLDNRSDLPDDVVVDAYVEYASLAGQRVGNVASYGGGTLMHREKFKPPENTVEEIKLARDVAEHDDDIGAAMGSIIATAFADGMEHFHEDPRQLAIFNGAARYMNLDGLLKELYREYLIASQVTTISLYGRTQINYTPEGGDGRARRAYDIVAPRVGVIHAEHIRALGNDLFSTSMLGFDPMDNVSLRMWLEEFFGPRTSPARKAEMRRQDPVSAEMFLGPVAYRDPSILTSMSSRSVYALNPQMVARTTMPKGSWDHPRPLLARSWELLEAKRLLTLLDMALLQGGIGFIVVAKKGSDEKPAKAVEVENLKEVVRRASRTGVIVGDHRLSFEIITPNMEGMLSPPKRRLVGRKLVQSLLRVPEPITEEAAGEGMRAELEFISRVISGDRHDLKRHIENHIHSQIVARNPALREEAKLWFPKIILQGSQYFTDFVLKLRDRGDIPRKWAVEAAGFDYEAGLRQRERELTRGDDEILVPASVPYANPLQDNPNGRPPGGAADPMAPNRPTRGLGEPVTAMWDEVADLTFRAGVTTHALLEAHPEAEVGRISANERAGLEQGGRSRHGPLHVVCVNPTYEVDELAVARLGSGASVIVGKRRGDRAMVAKALTFREPDFDETSARETAMRWGYLDDDVD